ncbi:hypothetical protein AVEN_44837-1 [Araneus ventricosus]|uniref:Histone-lysine N-methyltransferase SETMAR n=1 Tax=Araneus ventricosus TaxID=182803 RepID=A0A4Y2CJZ5_ARAVE|nr:hypothetical protein AVEN_44837-1 [Araneus ventricosus]
MFDLVKFILSPDLAPSDFHLFSHLKKFLAGKQFASDDEIKVNVQNWFRSHSAEFYEAGMLQLVARYASIRMVNMSKSSLRCVDFSEIKTNC